MSPATATQDEDLLIISEDSAADTADIDFSFSFGDDTSSETTSVSSETHISEPELALQEEVSENPLAMTDITSDMITSTEEAISPEVSEVATTRTQESSDFSFDIGNFETPESNVVMDTVEPEIEVPTNTFTLKTPESSEIASEEGAIVTQENDSTALLGVETEEVIVGDEVLAPAEEAQVMLTETQTEAVQENTDESLNDILTATIAKLTLRAAAIEKDSSSKAAQIASIEEEIKALQEQVSSLEGDISLLHSEADKISKNIEALEDMKLDPVKEHNARRVAKK